MKKTVFLLLLTGICLGAQAQMVGTNAKSDRNTRSYDNPGTDHNIIGFCGGMGFGWPTESLGLQYLYLNNWGAYVGYNYFLTEALKEGKGSYATFGITKKLPSSYYVYGGVGLGQGTYYHYSTTDFRIYALEGGVIAVLHNGLTLSGGLLVQLFNVDSGDVGLKVGLGYDLNRLFR